MYGGAYMLFHAQLGREVRKLGWDGESLKKKNFPFFGFNKIWTFQCSHWSNEKIGKVCRKQTPIRSDKEEKWSKKYKKLR